MAMEANEPTSEPESRRLRLYLFSPEALITLGMDGPTLRVVKAPIPPDARALSVHWDEGRRAFAVCVESAEFGPVALGEAIPVADAPWFEAEWWGPSPLRVSPTYRPEARFGGSYTNHAAASARHFREFVEPLAERLAAEASPEPEPPASWRDRPGLL